MISENSIDQEFLHPKDRRGLFDGLLYVGRVFSEHSWPNLEAVLRQRIEAIDNVENDFSTYTRLTYLAVVLFFSYVDAAALSTKTILLRAQKKHLLQKLSNKQQALLDKDPERVGFEDLMKIQFSILPHSLGAPREYGTLKQQSLPCVFKLREVRNRIVHPVGLKDLVGVDIEKLDSEDINVPMAEFMKTLQETLARCAKCLVPSDKRNDIGLLDWLQKREFNLK